MFILPDTSSIIPPLSPELEPVVAGVYLRPDGNIFEVFWDERLHPLFARIDIFFSDDPEPVSGPEADGFITLLENWLRRSPGSFTTEGAECVLRMIARLRDLAEWDVEEKRYQEFWNTNKHDQLL